MEAREIAAATLARGAVDGSAYELQERLPGAPMERVTAAMLPSVLALDALQRDIGVMGRGPWIDEMVSTILDGRIGYCEHGVMAEDSAETRALLERCLRIADGARGLRVSDTDVVHYDFSPYNVLTEGNGITGVVDWTIRNHEEYHVQWFLGISTDLLAAVGAG